MDTGITEGAALGPSKSPGGIRTATVGLVGLALAAGVATAASYVMTLDGQYKKNLELIQGFVIAMNLETTEEELFHTIFPHPTLSETMKEAVLDAYGRALNA